jgi:hypothetical protein
MYQDSVSKKKQWRQIYHANSKQKRAGIIILFLDRAAFRLRQVIRNKEMYYIMIKKIISSRDITNSHVCVPNDRLSKCTRQKLRELQGEIDEFAIVVSNPSIRNKKVYQAENQ